ncbi:MAG: segregation and condensation protein A [Acidimicrobiales bacterium]
MVYEVQTAVYEGPFDLLLHLITREEVDLYEVSLSRIVDAYLAELEIMAGGGARGSGPGLDLDVATEFLLIAATLVELKSRRLLPGRESLDLDEELALFEERDLLLARLLEAKTFKDAAAHLARLADAAQRSQPRRAGLEERFLAVAPDLLAGVGPADLAAAYRRALQPRPAAPRVDLDHVAPIRVSVRDTLEALVASLPEAGPTSLRRLTEEASERIEVIVTFLALLELYKQGLVELDQAFTFGELRVRWIGGDHGAEEGADVLARMDPHDGD